MHYVDSSVICSYVTVCFMRLTCKCWTHYADGSVICSHLILFHVPANATLSLNGTGRPTGFWL